MPPILGETFIHQSDEFIPSYIGKPDSMQLTINRLLKTFSDSPFRIHKHVVGRIFIPYFLDFLSDVIIAQNTSPTKFVGECNRSEEHTSELQSRQYLVCRLLLEKKKKKKTTQLNYQS